MTHIPDLVSFNLWKSRFRYLSLFDNLVVPQIIDEKEFCHKFIDRWKTDIDTGFSLPNLFLLGEFQNEDPEEIEEYVTIINMLSIACKSFLKADPALRKDYEISKEQLRDQATEAYFLINAIFS